MIMSLLNPLELSINFQLKMTMLRFLRYDTHYSKYRVK